MSEKRNSRFTQKNAKNLGTLHIHFSAVFRGTGAVGTVMTTAAASAGVPKTEGNAAVP